MDLRLILFLTISVLAAALLARMIPVGKDARRGPHAGRAGAKGDDQGRPGAQGAGPYGDPRARAHDGRARGGVRGGPQRMPANVAREVLGLPTDASPDDVRQAYRRLIAKNHPDAGGSAWITQRLNEARDALIGPGAR